ncbi:hypothetical protein BC835DRAFT_1418899 [Cytidiella melzeri]|nr:hypothetical protein BC835DRAFT_1523167 [Cytidiella melzeri]KAI0688781.1 hypothetical protein BC835DRAFT_1418899 [Cytidiella melzeri]
MRLSSSLVLLVTIVTGTVSMMTVSATPYSGRKHSPLMNFRNLNRKRQSGIEDLQNLIPADLRPQYVPTHEEAVRKHALAKQGLSKAEGSALKYGFKILEKQRNKNPEMDEATKEELKKLKALEDAEWEKHRIWERVEHYWWTKVQSKS